MQIAPKKVVSLTYILTLANGDQADQATADHPFAFIHGVGQTLPAFDQHLQGLEPGAAFDFTLTPEEGYGRFNPEMLVDLDIKIFQGPEVPADLLSIGNMVPMQDNHGNPLHGIVREVTDSAVKMDFNHPLADETLHFSGNILEVREASAEELDHGHVHGPGGHHH